MVLPCSTLSCLLIILVHAELTLTPPGMQPLARDTVAIYILMQHGYIWAPNIDQHKVLMAHIQCLYATRLTWLALTT